MNPRAFLLAEFGVPAALLAAAAALFLLLVRPACLRLEETRGQWEELGGEVNDSLELAAQKQSLHEEIDLLDQALGRLEEGLSPVTGTYKFLQELEELSRSERIELEQVVPGNLQTGPEFSLLPVRVRTGGPMLNLLRFLARIESSALLVRLERLSFTPHDDSSDMQLEATFQVFCFDPSPASEARP